MTNTINKIMHNGTEFNFESVNWWVTSFNWDTGAVTYTAPVTSVNGNTWAVTVNDVKQSASAPSSPTEWTVWYDTTNDVLKVYDGTNWNEVGGWGADYSWIEKEVEQTDIPDYSAMQWPAPTGYHIPLTTEWQWLKTIMNWLSLTTPYWWRTNLHMPYAGYRNNSDASLSDQGSYGYYWSSSASSSYARYLRLYLSTVLADNDSRRVYGYSVRCFKNSYVAPDSSWTVVQWTLWSAWIFWNQSEWLISITDGSTGYTIMDKNLWATTVYNDWDTLTQANMWNMYQWWNNYWFPSTWTISNTSSTQVDASAYWPTNPYSSDTFITWSYDWSSVYNGNLRWWETWVQLLTWFDLSLRTIAREPSSDFTLIAPSSISDWEEYVLRCINVASHTMTLWEWFTNPFDVDLSLSANATDQFVFLAVQWTLELQPQVVISDWTVSTLVAWTTASSNATTATLITNS